MKITFLLFKTICPAVVSSHPISISWKGILLRRQTERRAVSSKTLRSPLTHTPPLPRQDSKRDETPFLRGLILERWRHVSGSLVDRERSLDGKSPASANSSGTWVTPDCVIAYEENSQDSGLWMERWVCPGLCVCRISMVEGDIVLAPAEPASRQVGPL